MKKSYEFRVISGEFLVERCEVRMNNGIVNIESRLIKSFFGDQR